MAGRLTRSELQARFAAKLRTTDEHRALHRERQTAEGALNTARKAKARCWVDGDTEGQQHWQKSMDFWQGQIDSVTDRLERLDRDLIAAAG